MFGCVPRYVHFFVEIHEYNNTTFIQRTIQQAALTQRLYLIDKQGNKLHLTKGDLTKCVLRGFSKVTLYLQRVIPPDRTVHNLGMAILKARPQICPQRNTGNTLNKNSHANTYLCKDTHTFMRIYIYIYAHSYVPTSIYSRIHIWWHTRVYQYIIYIIYYMYYIYIHSQLHYAVPCTTLPGVSLAATTQAAVHPESLRPAAA